MAYEEDYRAYREVIAAGVALLCPHYDVRTAAPDEFEAELERFDPWVVVCGLPGRSDPGRTLAWVELPAEVVKPARVRVGDERREHVGLTLEGLMGIVDEVEGLVRAREVRAEGQEPTESSYPTS